MCDNLAPRGHFIDTSFGILGKDCKSIHVMYLDEAIKKVKWSFRMKDKLNRVKSEKEKSRIIERIAGKHEQSEVYHYNVSEHIERILQLNRS
jgi:ethanolamine utilization microcompartment shell protein EutL